MSYSDYLKKRILAYASNGDNKQEAARLLNIARSTIVILDNAACHRTQKTAVLVKRAVCRRRRQNW